MREARLSGFDRIKLSAYVYARPRWGASARQIYKIVGNLGRPLADCSDGFLHFAFIIKSGRLILLLYVRMDPITISLGRPLGRMGVCVCVCVYVCVCMSLCDGHILRRWDHVSRAGWCPDGCINQLLHYILVCMYALLLLLESFFISTVHMVHRS